APNHAELDVLDERALCEFLQDARPQTVVNSTAWAGVDDAEAERGDTQGTVYRLNAEYPGRLADLCHKLGTHLVHLSTDYVFDGTNAERPYTERDTANPLCWYAQTKLRGEHAVLEANQLACVTRIEMPFTGRGHHKSDLARATVARLKAGNPIQGVTDQRITPVFLDHAVDAVQKL